MNYGNHKSFWLRLATMAKTPRLKTRPRRLGHPFYCRLWMLLLPPSTAGWRPLGGAAPICCAPTRIRGRPQFGHLPEAFHRRLSLARSRGLWLRRRDLDLRPGGACFARRVWCRLPPRPCRTHPQDLRLDAPTADRQGDSTRRGRHSTLGERGLADAESASRERGPHTGVPGRIGILPAAQPGANLRS